MFRPLLFRIGSKPCHPILSSPLVFSQLNQRQVNSLNRSFSTKLVPFSSNGSVHKITLPLKTGSCSFSLSSDQNIQDLIKAIHEEDYSADISVYQQGHKVASSVPVRCILGDGFEIHVSGEKYQVPATRTIGTLDGFRGTIDANTILEKENFNRIRVLLKDDIRTTISLDEFLEICRKYHVEKGEALDLLKSLHYSGVILNFHQNKILKDIVFLHPREVTGQILQGLEIPSTLAADIDQRIKEVEAELRPLQELKESIDQKAAAKTKTSQYLGFGFLTANFAFLFRLVWFDLGWDIMEPVAYFIGLGTTMAGFVFYSFTGRGFGFPDIWSYIYQRSWDRLKVQEHFDLNKYNALLKELQDLSQQKDKSEMVSKLI